MTATTKSTVIEPIKVMSVDFRIQPGTIVQARQESVWKRCRVDDISHIALLVTPIDDGCEGEDGEQFAVPWGKIELVPRWEEFFGHVTRGPDGTVGHYQRVPSPLDKPVDMGGRSSGINFPVMVGDIIQASTDPDEDWMHGEVLSVHEHGCFIKCTDNCDFKGRVYGIQLDCILLDTAQTRPGKLIAG